MEETIGQKLGKKLKIDFFQLKLLLHPPCCHILSYGVILHAPFPSYLPQVKKKIEDRRNRIGRDTLDASIALQTARIRLSPTTSIVKLY